MHDTVQCKLKINHLQFALEIAGAYTDAVLLPYQLGRVEVAHIDARNNKDVTLTLTARDKKERRLAERYITDMLKGLGLKHRVTVCYAQRKA